MSLHSPAAPIAVTEVPTLIYKSYNGTAQFPQRILVENESATNNVAFGGADVTYAGAPKVIPSAFFETRLEAGEALYAICNAGLTANVSYVATRHNNAVV